MLGGMLYKNFWKNEKKNTEKAKALRTLPKD
jgi:hypothetical protein